MCNTDSTSLYLDVLKHIWVVFHGKLKTCIMGTIVCVEDKEHVFPVVEAYLNKLPWKTRNRLATAMQLCDILCLVIYFGEGKQNYVFTTMDREAQRSVFLPIF
jgi:hypothetical protein